MKLEQAARQALEALETLDCGDSYKTHNAATALREALAEQAEQEQEQEPVAWMYKYYTETRLAVDKNTSGMHVTDSIPLYAAPVRTKDLTDDEIETAKYCLPRYLAEITDEDLNDFARAVIAADREINK